MLHVSRGRRPRHADGRRRRRPAGAVAGRSPRVQAHRDYVIKTLLHGLSGPIGGKTFPQVMIPMGAQTDTGSPTFGSYIRNSFGNTGTFIAPADVARVRAGSKSRTTPWTAAEIEGALPVLMQSHAGWKPSASHNTAAAAQGLTLAGWTSSNRNGRGCGSRSNCRKPQPSRKCSSTRRAEAGWAEGVGIAGAAGAARLQQLALVASTPLADVARRRHRRRSSDTRGNSGSRSHWMARRGRRSPKARARR